MSALLHFVAPDPWASLFVVACMVALFVALRVQCHRIVRKGRVNVDRMALDAAQDEIARRRAAWSEPGLDLDFDWPDAA